MVADSGFWIKCSSRCTMFQNGFIPSSPSTICLALVIGPKNAKMIDSPAFLMINKRTVNLLFRSLEYLPSICALSIRAIYRIYYGVNMETRGSSPVFTNFEVRRV